MRYTEFTIHFKEGDSISFKDDPEAKLVYDLKYPDNGALLVEKCDGNHAPRMPRLGGDPRNIISQLEDAIQEASQHEHQFVVMYAPGTWVRVDFAGK